jgi:hypothetical protein
MGQLVNCIQHIFEDQSTVFKLNLSFGFVLFNNETQQMQYHHPSANNGRVFDSPFQIRNREDLAQVRAFFNYITGGGGQSPPAPMVAPPHSTILAPPSQSPFSLKYKQNMEFRREV